MRMLRVVFLVLMALYFTDMGASTRAAARGNEQTRGTNELRDDQGAKDKKKRKSRSYADKMRNRFPRPMLAAPKPKPKYKEWEEVVKDARMQKGLLTLYIDREDVLLEIRKDQLDTPMLAVLSLSKGIGANRILGGLPIDDMMFDFHRTEDHIQMRRLNTRFRAGSDSALAQAVDLTYGNSVLYALPIESENDSTGSVLVNMNDVFLSDLPDIGEQMKSAIGRAVRLESKKGFYNEIKTFPTNVEIDVRLTYTPMDTRDLQLPSVPDPRFIEVGVQYSIRTLPEVPMQPRLADDRVGYFLTPFKDFSRDTHDSPFVHYINRWRLEKKDSTAALSEPKTPIVFYIDHTVPKQYRPYIAQGIEGWQKAFEAAGFKNAIIAKEAPDDTDFDPEDARFNTIRWIVSDAPSFLAIGPSRKDPRTGEILDADILIESNVIQSYRKTYQRYAGPDAMLEEDPFLRFIEYSCGRPGEDREPELFGNENDEWCCDIGQGMAEGGAFLRLALLARGDIERGMDVPEAFIGDALRDVAMHEVGHTLGLRHNFKSSTATPYGDLNDRAVIDTIGFSGSIMDYTPPNVAADRSEQGYYFAPSLGPYDLWAIKWGYMEVAGATPEERDSVLQPLARDAWKKGYRYGTDEDTYPAAALDPLCNIWDLGDDPLKFAVDRMTIVKDLLSDGALEDRVVEDGDSYATLRSAVETLFRQYYTAIGMAVKYVGGQYTTRTHKGDPKGAFPLEPLPANDQRRAMKILVEYTFSPDAFKISPELLNKLNDPKLRDWENNPMEIGRRFDFPLLNWIGAIQRAMLARLLQPYQLQRIVEAEYRSADAYRLSECFNALTNAIWLDRPVPRGGNAVAHRNLQRYYIRSLTGMIVSPYGGTPDEAIALARLNLRRIRSAIDDALKRPNLGDAENAHLLESKARIERALDAKLEAEF